jgi:hypothetical protein
MRGNEMTNEQVIRRLENVALPDIGLEGHRRELRAALLREYARTSAQHGRVGMFAWLKYRPPAWKAVLIAATASLLAALVLTLSVFVPRFQPGPTPANIVETVLASKEVRAALGNEEMAAATVNDLGGQLVEVIVEGRGGAIIIARMDTRNETVRIMEISYVLLFGSIFEPQQPLTGEDRGKAIDVARTNSTFRSLLDEGFAIYRVDAVEAVISTRRLADGPMIKTSAKWAMIDLESQDSRWAFLIDPENGRVMDRGKRAIPKR